MRINNNMMAMNTHRQLGMAQSNGAKSMEKLSSGLRINRAGDDAAGLSISEKMRGQIRGLNQASRNAQDGISMIQTAEGALNETHAILQRMRELAVQSSNDTNVDIDRGAIQNEIDQLSSEIDRIGNTTEFNTQSLLKGDGSSNLDRTGLIAKTDLTGGATNHTNATQSLVISNATFAAGDSIEVNMNGEKVTVNFAADGAEGKATGEAYDVTENSVTVNLDGIPSTDNIATGLGNALEAVVGINSNLSGNYDIDSSVASTVTITAGGDYQGEDGFIGDATVTTAGAGAATGTAASVGTTTHVEATGSFDLSSIEDTDVATTDENLKALVGQGITINDQQIEFYNSNDGEYEGSAVGVDISDALYEGTYTNKASALIDSIVSQSDKIEGVDLSNDAAKSLVVTATEGGTSGNDIGVSDGGIQENFKATFQIGANESQTMDVEIADMRSDALGISEIDLSTSEGAQEAITTLNGAIESVSAQRSDLGAFQNRLDHSIKNLDNSGENLQAAESAIRDVDMAKEMMEMTKNNILQQASQSMLAQANQAPQSVLQLLG